MPICGAKAKSTGRQCGNLALNGQRTCRIHGGAAPQAKAKAKEREAEQQARRELTKLDALLGPAEAIADPLGELLKLGGEAKRWKELLAGRVAELTSVGYQGVMGEQVKAEVLLLERAMDRLGSILATIAKLGIDERLTRIAEGQANTVLKVVEAICGYAQLTGEEAATARRIAAAILTGNTPPRVEPAASRVVEIEVPVPTAPPPQLERRQIEAPRPQSTQFVIDAPSQPSSGPVQPPFSPSGSDSTPEPPSASQGQQGRDFWQWS